MSMEYWKQIISSAHFNIPFTNVLGQLFRIAYQLVDAVYSAQVVAIFVSEGQNAVCFQGALEYE